MTEDFRLLTTADIKSYLGELLDRLAARGVEVETYIIGGAAMAIHLGREQKTPDIDGIFRPAEAVLAEAKVMSEEYGLAPDWVNSRAFSFISFDPADDADAIQVELRGHKVTVASKRVLLALKIAASRPKDRNDTSRLIHDLGITDPEEIVDLAFSVFGEYSITLGESRQEVRYLAEEALVRSALFTEESSRPTVTSSGSTDVGGDVWVNDHVRNGHPVHGHFRHRPGSDT